ncbi:MAG: enoyl-CoA hydratase-related protein [Planctomycetales bacterium]
MADPIFRTEIAGGVARVTLNRPQKRNALTRELIGLFAESLAAIRGDESVRLVIVAAEGPVFCAGMDLGEMQGRAGSPNAAEEWREDTRVYRELVERLYRFPLPTLAVLQGPVLAGGVGIVAACDLVLAAEGAFFALPEPQRGITAAVVAPLLIRRAGIAGASHLLLSGRNLSAEAAMRMGLCHEVVPASDLDARVSDWASSILTGSPSALAITKRLLLDAAGDALSEQLDAAMEISARARETADAREGLAAFLDKRPPAWQPRGE